METFNFNRLDMASADGTQLNLEALYSIAPSVFTETHDPKTGKLSRKVNFDALRQLLGDAAVDDGGEMYQFTWPGKSAAKAEAARPIDKTLRPVMEDSVDWDTTKNIYIEGDNLEVLKLLQRSYLGAIKMIYIDPPYNTGNDFVYFDKRSHTEKEEDLAAGNIDELGNRFRKNTDSNGRFHSDWCSMIYPRLLVARSLLAEDGYLCMSIDDNEDVNAKKICDEIFGESNFVSQFIIIRSEGGGLAKRAVIGHDYMLVYAKDINKVKPLGRPKDVRGKIVLKDGVQYWIETDWLREEFGKYGTCHYEDILKFYDVKKLNDIDLGLKKGNYILIPKGDKHIVGRLRKLDEDTSKFYTILKHLNKNGVKDLADIDLERFFSYPKPISLVAEFIMGSTILSKKEENIILDFFSGSATTAHAVMQLNAEDGGNRKFIMVQLPEETSEDSEARKAGYKNICEIGKERIRRASNKIRSEFESKIGSLQNQIYRMANATPSATASLLGPSAQNEMRIAAFKENALPLIDEVNRLSSILKNLDTGFRVFRLDESNYEQVSKAPKEYKQEELDLFANNIKADRTDLDLLFGAMLAWGVTLDQPMAKETVDGHTIYTVNEGDLVACFDEGITDKVVEAMADKAPLRMLFRDTCFAEDAQKINIYEQLKQLLDWTDDEAFKNIRVI